MHNTYLSELSTEELRKIQSGHRALGTQEAAHIAADAIAAELNERYAPGRRVHMGLVPSKNAMRDASCVAIEG